MLRRIFFWCHLSIGLGVGIIILSMCVTGSILAFEHQITDFAERAYLTVIPPSPEAKALNIETLLTQVRAAYPDKSPTFVFLKSNPKASATVRFGEEFLYVDPYTGRALGPGSKARAFLHDVEDWHRYLSYKKIGKPITGAAAIGFFALSLSGLYLWWPRKIYSYKRGLQGKAKEWSWHNAAGFWVAPFVFVITATGIIMSYGLFKPAPKPADDEARKDPPASLQTLVTEEQGKNPHWKTLIIRLPQKAEQRTSVSSQPQPGKRPFRSWVKPLHTGQEFGLPHHLLNFLVAMAGILQVWTGFSLAYRRYRNR